MYFMKGMYGVFFVTPLIPQEKKVKQDIKLTEIYAASFGSPVQYRLRSIYVNPTHVICLREDDHMGNLLSEGRLIDGLDPRQSFTKISVTRTSYEEDITVVGSLDEIYNKLKLQRQQLLKG
tara:strand:- start:452 stop:814 length:363 start_codon:yes stop_codon:yes gene_type:complete